MFSLRVFSPGDDVDVKYVMCAGAYHAIKIMRVYFYYVPKKGLM